MLPTWSVTVGKRGIGVKKLARRRFVDYDGFNGIDLDETRRCRRLRIATRTGTVTIFPSLAEADQLLAHVRSVVQGPNLAPKD